MSGSDEIERRIAHQLAASARTSRDGWADASTYVRKYLAAHASAGGILDDLLSDVGFIGAADPALLIAELGDLARSEDPTVRGSARAYLRLGSDRIGTAYGQRIANYVLACAADEPDARPHLGRLRSSLPWSVNFVDGTPLPFHPLSRYLTGDLMALTVSPEDEIPLIATSDGGHNIQVWDGLSGDLITRWRAHEDVVAVLKMIRLEERLILISGSADSTIRFWDPLTAELDRRIAAASPVLSLAVDSRYSTIAAGGQDGVVRSWALDSGRPLREFVAHRDSVAALQFWQSRGEELLVSGGLDRIVNVWSVATSELVRSVSGPTGSILDIAICELDDHLLVAAASSDESIWVWNAETGREFVEIRGHLGAVNCLAVVRFGGETLLASGSADMTVRLWDMATGIVRRTLVGHVGAIRGLCSTARDGRPALASGSADRSVRVWDLESGASIAPTSNGGPFSDVVLTWGDSSTASQEFERAALSSVRSVRLSRDPGPMIAVVGRSDGRLQTCDVASGTIRQQWEAHSGGVLAVARDYMGESSVIISGGADGTVRVWGADDGVLVREMIGHGDSVWGVSAGEINGQQVIVSASRDRTARAWDPRSGEELIRFEGSQERLWGVSCEQIDGQAVVAAGSTDRTVWVWDAESGLVRTRLHGHRRGVRFVATAELKARSVIAASGADGAIIIWDLATSAVVATLNGHGDGVWGIAAGVVGDRPVLASASDDLSVRVWDLLSGRSLAIPLASPGYAVDLHEATLIIGTDRHLVSIQLNEQMFDEMAG